MNKKVENFAQTWWWRAIQVIFATVVFIVYVAYTTLLLRESDSILLGIVSFLFSTSSVALCALVLRTAVYYIIEGNSEATKQSFKYALWALLFSAIALGGFFSIIHNQSPDTHPYPPPAPPEMQYFKR